MSPQLHRFVRFWCTQGSMHEPRAEFNHRAIYRLTRNCYKNCFQRIICFAKSEWILHPLTCQQRRAFSRNYATDSYFSKVMNVEALSFISNVVWSEGSEVKKRHHAQVPLACQECTGTNPNQQMFCLTYCRNMGHAEPIKY